MSEASMTTRIEAGGFNASSRWSSAAIPPVHGPDPLHCIPARMPASGVARLRPLPGSNVFWGRRTERHIDVARVFVRESSCQGQRAEVVTTDGFHCFCPVCLIQRDAAVVGPASRSGGADQDRSICAASTGAENSQQAPRTDTFAVIGNQQHVARRRCGQESRPVVTDGRRYLTITTVCPAAMAVDARLAGVDRRSKQAE